MLLSKDSTGPALIAVAATIKPHLPQRGGDITIYKEAAEESPAIVRVPIARAGIYRHPRGKIEFTRSVFSAMIKNHKNRVTDNPVHLDSRHKEHQGALAWLDVEDGGELVVEGDWLVAYGPTTGQWAVDLIKSKRFRFASAEFTPDYRSNLYQKLSTDEMEEQKPMEINLHGQTFQVDETESGFVFTKEQLDQIKSMLSGEADKLEAQSKKITKLEAALEQPDEPDVPPEFLDKMKEMEQIVQKLEREKEMERVGFILEKARNRKEDGYILPESVIDLAKEAMLHDLSDTVTLEEATSSNRGYWKRLLLEVLPPTVPTDQKTEPDPDVQKLEKSSDIEEEIAELIEQWW